ncbi:MAG: cytochrome c-type biogenesis protein [Porticoccaceae bacterium]
MPMYFLKLLLTSSLLLLPLAFSERSELLASTEVVEFSDPQLRKRYYQLVQELRCPKCQNQNLADSNAPISKDMKAQIYSMLEAKNTDDEIKQHLVSRYSEFVLYRPEVNTNTWFLWFAPICLVLVGVFIVWRYAFASDRAQSNIKSDTAALTEEQQQQLSQLLDKDDNL